MSEPSRDLTLSSVALTPDFLQQDGGESGKEESPFSGQQLVLGSMTVAATALSVGYVVWLIRGGSLLMSLITVIPTWRSFDPLPILESFEEAQAKREEDGESLITLVG
jgi:hypothetical protein